MEPANLQLNKTILFKGLSEEFAQDLTTGLRRHKVKKGASLKLDIPEGGCLYLILYGELVSVSKPTSVASKESDPVSAKTRSSSTGNKTEPLSAGAYGPGDYFGEQSLLEGGPRTIELKAGTDAELVCLERKDIFNICFHHSQAIRNFYAILMRSTPIDDPRLGALLESLFETCRLIAGGLVAGKIGYDIQSPLTVITFTAQLIANLFPDSLEFTKTIIQQARIVEDATREIQDFAQGRSVEYPLQKVDIEIFLKDALEAYLPSLEGRGITVRMENKCIAPVYLAPGQIRRVLHNLLRNSLEALAKQGEIIVQASLASNWLQISVIDNGPGVPENIAPHLFEPFMIFAKPHGAGLGLPLCAKMAQDLGGHLEYRPVQPHGSRFDIRLPQNSA